VRYPCLLAKSNGETVGAKNRTEKSQRILSFKHWCELNNISQATGRRLIRAGKVRVSQLSDRRIGIAEDDNADYQARCPRGEPP
jgi:hypothetical protein